MDVCLMKQRWLKYLFSSLTVQRSLGEELKGSLSQTAWGSQGYSKCREFGVECGGLEDCVGEPLGCLGRSISGVQHMCYGQEHVVSDGGVWLCKDGVRDFRCWGM